MAKVIQLSARSDKDIIAALKQLLASAERGELKGLAVCAMDIRGKEHIAFIGEYMDNPALGVNAANRMSWRLTQLQEEQDAQASY